MGIFFSLLEDKNSILNEIEAVPTNTDSQDNSNTDYTQDNEQDPVENEDTSDNPSDAPEDYTIPDEGEDQTPEEADRNPPEGGDEGGGDPVANEDYGGVGGQEGGGDPNAGGDPGAGGNAGGGEEGAEDYTEGGEEGAEGEEDYGDNGGYDDPGKSNDEIQQLEDEIFSKFNSEQIAIMNRTLKENYNKLFITIDVLVDRINEVPKVMEYISVIEFASNKLAELRDMLSDYLYRTYNTKSYTENEIAYKRFVILANQITDLIGKIPTIKDPKSES